MKKIVGLLPALLFFHMIAICQEENNDNASVIQNPTFGVHFIFNDFKSAAYIRSTSLSAALKDKKFGHIKEMSAGLALNYMQGISKYFDLTTTLAGSFLDYPKQDGTSLGNDYLLLEGDASVRGKMFTNRYFIQPYMQLGVGISAYKGYWGAFIPVGVGLQLNLFDEAYLLINSQYRMPVTESTNYHFFYSIGLAGNIGGGKK